MSHIISLDDCDASVAHRVGGKALGLGALRRAGLRVPPGFAVTTDAYRECVLGSELRQEIARSLERLETIEDQRAASEHIRDLFAASDLPATVHQAIREGYERLAGGDVMPVAVRSSATAEDTAEASFAGQQETYLWIRGADAVARHVVRCWGSLFTPQVLAYRARLGISNDEISMAVVVQQMVAAEAAGVMITLDPVTGDRSAIAIESSFGLGLAVVGGEVIPDRFAADKVTFDIRSRAIGPKAIAYRFDAGTGVVARCDVPQDEQRRPSLTDEEVVELARMGRAVERAQGGPQDIEWAIGQGPDGPRQIFLLQTRAETVWARRTAAPISDPDTPILARMLRSMSTPLRIRDAAPVAPDVHPDESSG